MKIDPSDLKLIALIINEHGFTLIEDMIEERHKGQNTLARITGDAFRDGAQVGKAEALNEVLQLFGNIRSEIKSMEDK